MYFGIFCLETRTVYRGRRGTTGRFDHQFGGEPHHRGLCHRAGQPLVHQLFLLDTHDPRLGVALPRVRWLPLLCAIHYGACELGYRVLSDSEVQILYQSEAKAWEGFPRPNYPDALPAKPLDLEEDLYDPDDPRDVFFKAGVFGYDALTPAQFGRVVEFVEAEGLYDPEFGEWETTEEFVREGSSWPFLQGRPEDGCPAEGCRLYQRGGSLRVFALFQEAEKNVRKLWGPNGENLQIIYQICPACSGILVQNQCT